VVDNFLNEKLQSTEPRAHGILPVREAGQILIATVADALNL
jgi:hypothetical protein